MCIFFLLWFCFEKSKRFSSFLLGWKVVKGRWRAETHPSPLESLCLSAFQPKRWRVKGVFESMDICCGIDEKHTVIFALLWQYFAFAKAKYCHNKAKITVCFSSIPQHISILSKTPFTLHLLGWKADKQRDSRGEGWVSALHLPFTTFHPSKKELNRLLFSKQNQSKKKIHI